jgi:hypothetical protein
MSATELARWVLLWSGGMTEAEQRRLIELLRKQGLAFEEGRVGGAGAS